MRRTMRQTMRRTCLCVITARGGSKGVRNKNVRLLAGKSTIAYTIEVALACKYIDMVLVTTDSVDIQTVSLDAGAQVPFLRPAEISGDDAQQEDAILHAMSWCEANGTSYDLICLLDPTGPLRRLETLCQGFELLESRSDNCRGVMTVTRCDHSPVKAGTLPADGTLRGLIQDEYKWLNRQEIPAYYRISGMFCLSDWETFKTERTFALDDSLVLQLDSLEAMDIDEPLDFFLIEKLLENGLTTPEKLEKHVNG